MTGGSNVDNNNSINHRGPIKDTFVITETHTRQETCRTNLTMTEHAVRPVDYNNINSIEYNHGLQQRHTHMEETQSQSTIGEETHVEAILTPVSTRRIQPTLIEALPVDPKEARERQRIHPFPIREIL
jgi:hypothetical protein